MNFVETFEFEIFDVEKVKKYHLALQIFHLVFDVFLLDVHKFDFGLQLLEPLVHIELTRWRPHGVNPRSIHKTNNDSGSDLFRRSHFPAPVSTF